MDQNQHDQPAEGISHPTEGANNDQSQEILNETTAPTIPQTQTVDPSSYPGRPQYTPVIPQFMYQLQQGYLEQQLREFWASKGQEIEETTDFRTNTLPLARIKRIMKGDEDVSMVSAEAPMLFAKASEMFIQELTMRAWVNADMAKRRTLLQSDIMSAISGSEMYDFLIDIVPKVDPDNYVDILPRDDTMKQQVFAGIPYQHVAGLSSVTPTMVTAGLSSATPTMVTAGLSSATPTMVTGSNVPDENHDGQQTPFFPAAMMRSPTEEEDNHSPDLDDPREEDNHSPNLDD